MIKRSKQDWTVGSTVKVGFMALVVKATVATPGDYLPDAYILANIAGTQLYKFVPHNGLEKITPDEARGLMVNVKANAERVANEAFIRARAAAEIDSLFI